MENFGKPRNKPISSNINTKTFVVDSLAIGKSSFDISKQTNYPASTIRSFHKNNKDLVKQREKEIEAMLPDIITDLQFKTKTSLELSMHKYRPDIFENNTGYTDTQDILAFQNNLNKPHQKVLEKKGIFPSHMNLLNTGRITINQQNVVNPSIIKLVGSSALRMLAEAVDNGEDDEGNSDIEK